MASGTARVTSLRRYEPDQVRRVCGCTFSPHSQRASAPPVLFSCPKLYARPPFSSIARAIIAGATDSRIALSGEEPAMYALLIQLDIEPAHRDAYVAAISGHARRATDNEPGTVRFDVIRDEGDPNRVFIYEVYTNRAALDAHNDAASIAQFRKET